MKVSATDNQVESLAIEETAAIDVEGTTNCANAGGENGNQQQCEVAIPVDEQVHRNDTNIENLKRSILEKDSEQMVELKENVSETNPSGNVEIGILDDACNSLLSTGGNENTVLLNKRVAKKFRVLPSNKSRQGAKVNKIFFGTVGKPISGKEDSWRILYDDGDIDIFSRASVLDAIKYYDVNKDYDRVSRKTELNGEKGGTNTTTKLTKSTIGNVSGKAARKKTKAKVERREAVPVWTGPPDEEIDGGWPQGVSIKFVVILYLRSSRYYFVPALIALVEWIWMTNFLFIK